MMTALATQRLLRAWCFFCNQMCCGIQTHASCSITAGGEATQNIIADRAELPCEAELHCIPALPQAQMLWTEASCVNGLEISPQLNVNQ